MQGSSIDKKTCFWCKEIIHGNAHICPYCKKPADWIGRIEKHPFRITLGVLILMGWLIHAFEDKKSIDNKIDLEIQVKIIESPANLRPHINASNEVLALIPVGTKLTVLDKQAWQAPWGGWTLTWYKVNYMGKTGWISEHTCKVVETKIKNENNLHIVQTFIT